MNFESNKAGFDNLCKAISNLDLGTVKRLFANPNIAYFGVPEYHLWEFSMDDDGYYDEMMVAIDQVAHDYEPYLPFERFYHRLIPPVLKFAAFWGNLELANCMLKIIDENCLYPDTAAANKNAALKEAARSGNFSLFNKLLEIPAVCDDVCDEVLSLAESWDTERAIRRLKKITTVRMWYYDIDDLEDAAMDGKLDVVNQLLESEEFFNNHEAHYMALVAAAAEGYLGIVNRLLTIPQVRQHVSRNAVAFTDCALIVALQNGHIDVVNRLLEIPEVHVEVARSNKAIIYAAQEGHLDIVNRLLEIPEVVDRAMANENEALTFAALHGHLDIVNRLLEIPAVVDRAMANKNEALTLAALYGHLAIVRRLLGIRAVRSCLTQMCPDKVKYILTQQPYEMVYMFVRARWPNSGMQGVPAPVRSYLRVQISKAHAGLFWRQFLRNSGSEGLEKIRGEAISSTINEFLHLQQQKSSLKKCHDTGSLDTDGLMAARKRKFSA